MEELISHLEKYPDLDIKKVAKRTVTKYEDLRDAQLYMLRNCLTRDNKLWEV